MLSNTKYAEATYNSVLPEDFWKTDIMRSNTTCGTVHCDDDDDDDHYSIQVEDSFLGDGLSEAVCLTQGDEADDNSGGARRRPIHPVDFSSNLYESMKSVFTMVCQNAEITGDARIEALARRHMNELLQGVNQIMSDHHAGQNDFLGSIVSSHRPIDRRRKCKRKKSSSEPKRRSKQSKAEARSATSFSVDSVIS